MHVVDKSRVQGKQLLVEQRIIYTYQVSYPVEDYNTVPVLFKTKGCGHERNVNDDTRARNTTYRGAEYRCKAVRTYSYMVPGV